MNYSMYVQSIIAQGSNCYMTREAWEREQRKAAEGHEMVYEVTSKTAALAPGWYKNVFEPGERDPMTFGPFSTEAEADNFTGY